MALTIIVLLLMLGKGIEAQTFIAESTKLRKKIFEKYDREIRPSPMTAVTMTGMSLVDLRYDEKSSIMNMFVTLHLEWRDERLAWNESEYKEIDSLLNVSPKKIWLPDLAVNNSATVENILSLKEVMLLVVPSGRVLWLPPARIQVTCVSDLTLWPRDSQNCSVRLGSWAHSGHQIYLKVLKRYVIERDYRQFRVLADGSKIFSTHWNVENITLTRSEMYYKCCQEPYLYVNVKVSLRRNAPALKTLIQVPAICLSLLTLVVFLLPPSAGEKVTFGSVCLILNMLFLAYTSNIASHSPTQTPLIVDLLSTQLQLLVLSVLVSAIVIRIAAKPHSYQVPSALIKVLRALSSCLCFGNYLEMDPEDKSQSRSYPDTSKDGDMEMESSQDIPLTSSMYPTLSNESSCPKTENLPGYSSLPTVPADAIHPSSEDLDAIQCDRAIPDGQQRQDICPRRRSHTHDWLLVAAAVDRLAFLLYSAACIGTLCHYRLALV